jgi:hypothetical protein
MQENMGASAVAGWGKFCLVANAPLHHASTVLMWLRYFMTVSVALMMQCIDYSYHTSFNCPARLFKRRLESTSFMMPRNYKKHIMESKKNEHDLEAKGIRIWSNMYVLKK